MVPTLTTTDRTIKERKWFGLGHRLHSENVEDVLVEAGFNWTVSKRPIVTTSYIPPETIKTIEPEQNPFPLNSNGTRRVMDLRYHLERLLRHLDDENIQAEVSDILNETEATYLPHYNEFSIVRNDTNRPFGVMGRIYQCINNLDCLKMLQPLLDQGRITFERAGEFNDGASCWVLVKFPESITVGTDVLDRYMKLSWSHDGTEKLSATFIALLQRTNTQINPVLDGSNVSIEIRHTTNAPERIQLAKTLLAKGEIYFQKLEEVLGELVNMPMTDDQMDEYLETLIPDSKKEHPDDDGIVKVSRAALRREEVMHIFKKTDDSIAHTKWAAFGAVAKWCDHDKGVRITGQNDADSDEQLELKGRETRLKGIWSKAGSASQLKKKAFAAIIKD